MSIDINWDTITSGPDGEALAESIRSFVHDKFQQVTLPGFIRSVEVHSFDFGKTCPQLEIKDIGDPLPDFYDDDDEDIDGGADSQPTSTIERDRDIDLSQHNNKEEQSFPGHAAHREDQAHAASLHDISHSRAHPPNLGTNFPGLRSPFNLADQLGSPFPRSGTPGIPGGTSNLSYFHLPVGGLSGTQTPLAAVASGTNFPPGGWSDLSPAHEHPNAANPHEHLNATNAHRHPAECDSNSTTRPSTATSLVIPPTPISHNGIGLQPLVSPHLHSSTQIPHLVNAATAETNAAYRRNSSPNPTPHQQQPTDLQIVTHVKYAGDIRLTLTAEILLDYPMPSFVGIPLKLSITGLTFDGVAVLASIKKNLHFCFLTPEDAEVLVGGAGEEGQPAGEEDELDAVPGAAAADGDRNKQKHKQKQRGREKGGREKPGGLLEEIRVESEIGRKEGGKQVLKNVGKVERFVLEQVRRIFEDEFVFPSFWTFLV